MDDAGPLTKEDQIPFFQPWLHAVIVKVFGKILGDQY